MRILLFLYILFCTIIAEAENDPLQSASDTPQLAGDAGFRKGSSVKIVAIVNDQPITNIYYQQRLDLAIKLFGMPTTPELQKQTKEQILQTLIDEQLIIQDAGANGIKATEQDIKSAWEKVAEMNKINVAELKNHLKNDGIDIAALEKQIIAQILQSKLFQMIIAPQIAVTPREIAELLETKGFITQNKADAAKDTEELVWQRKLNVKVRDYMYNLRRKSYVKIYDNMDQ